MQYFSQAQASRLAGCSQHQAKYWSQIGLVTPTATGGRGAPPYRFADLVALRLVKSLLDGGMTLRQVRRAFEFVRENAELGESTAISGVKLVTDGRTIFEVCRSDGEILDALKRGQLAMFVALDEITQSVDEVVREFQHDRDELLAGLSKPDARATAAR